MILFHGLPGTGKTYCIQHLLTRIENKIPIYLSSDMISNFTDPEFIDFLLYEANIFNKLDENLFFIIEDSEQLVMQRDDNYINNGISNLLNTTDGILNGMLNIQALLTFNTDIKNVDTAILRNERLLGQFEFGPIKSDRIKKLAEYLKIENIPDDFYKGNNVIADVYALNKKRNTIKFIVDDDLQNKNFIL
jgi:tRNA uridine 5-carbamoylmethylation protein Kti12